MEEFQKRAAQLEAEIEKLKEKLPESEEELNAFLSSISQRGQNARVARWKRFEQLDPEDNGVVFRVPITLEFVATYDSATSFFWEISQMGNDGRTVSEEQVVNVIGLEVKAIRNKGTKADDSEETGLVEVKCTAETFLYKGGAPEEGDSGGKKRKRRKGGQ